MLPIVSPARGSSAHSASIAVRFALNIKSKHLQFTMNAWRTTVRVLGNHAEDELAKFPADTRSSHTDSMQRKPSPIQLELCSPANHSLWLDENQRLFGWRREGSGSNLSYDGR